MSVVATQNSDIVALALRISTDKDFSDQLNALVKAKAEAQEAFQALALGKEAVAAKAEADKLLDEAKAALEDAKMRADKAVRDANTNAQRITKESDEAISKARDELANELELGRGKLAELSKAAAEAEQRAAKAETVIAKADDYLKEVSAKAEKILSEAKIRAAEASDEQGRLVLIASDLKAVLERL